MKQKHLSLDEREIIEDMLKEKFNLTQIGEKVGKHRTTISKEILNHRFKKDYIQYNTYFANCVNVDTCENAGTKWCKHSCKNYKEKECVLLNTPPYVCNGCSKKSRCRLSKYYYRAKDANNEYISFRSESRQGIRISKDEIYEINNIITPLIRDKKQSINHVFINHPDLLYFSKTTFYTYANNNIFSFRNIDLPRKVKYKPRKNNENFTDDWFVFGEIFPLPTSTIQARRDKLVELSGVKRIRIHDFNYTNFFKIPTFMIKPLIYKELLSN